MFNNTLYLCVAIHMPIIQFCQNLSKLCPYFCLNFARIITLGKLEGGHSAPMLLSHTHTKRQTNKLTVCVIAGIEVVCGHADESGSFRACW